MTPLEYIAGDHIIEMDFIDVARRDELSSLCQIAVAGTLDIKTGTHHVDRGTVGSDIEQSDPEVHITASTGKIDFRVNRAGDLSVMLERC